MSTANPVALSTRHNVLLLISILLIAATLRAPITAIGPLLEMIRDSFQLSRAEAGMLTTLPLLAFAALSPFVAILAREYGLERMLLAALLVIGGGILIRSTGSVWALYIGTWVIGSGIATANVLLPSLLKRDFPGKIITVTTFYVLAMTLVAALASAIAIPLAQTVGLGWSASLDLILLLPLLSLLFWIPQLKHRTRSIAGVTAPPHSSKVWHSPLAWQVAIYMGITCLVYYVAIAWLPAILADAHYSSAQAGSLHGLMQLSGAAPGIILLPLLPRLKDQRLVAFASPILGTLGLLGLAFYPAWAALWVVLFGLGMSAALILSLAFVGLRSGNLQQAASLSAMAQSVGYLLAAIGPTLAGKLHDASGSWGLALGSCIGLCVVMAVIGGFAGRATHVK